MCLVQQFYGRCKKKVKNTGMNTTGTQILSSEAIWCALIVGIRCPGWTSFDLFLATIIE